MCCSRTFSRAMLPTQTVAAIEKATARPMISHMAPTTRLRLGSRAAKHRLSACRQITLSDMAAR